MTNRNRNQGRSFANRPQSSTANDQESAAGGDSPTKRWRRTSVVKEEPDGSVSTTIRFPKARYEWLHQVSSTTGRAKSELVDEALGLLAERMGYGARPQG